MKITLLGTGTSQGIPVIGCDCAACLSDDPHDDRLRSGVLLEYGDTNILIDTGPDLRQQMLRYQVERVDAILYTHEHNDHIIGLDDIRPFNFRQRVDMPLYGLPRVMDELEARFSYIFKANPYPGAPRAVINRIDAGTVLSVAGIEIEALSVMHGRLPILGYRIDDFVFITDASALSSETRDRIRGASVLVLNALQPTSHHSHFSLPEAVEIAKELEVETTYLTHISHVMGPQSTWSAQLPADVFPAYDGLTIHL